MQEKFVVRKRQENHEDALHCLQVAFAMAVEILTGEEVTPGDAERSTGFRSGVETWPYTMIWWLTTNGYEVIHYDALDALAFAADPLAELRRSGFTEDLISYFVKISDFGHEGRMINDAAAAGARFEVRLPDAKDVTQGLADGWLPLIALDAGALTAEYRQGYQGHMVLATGFDPASDVVRLQDSGPPPAWDWDVTADHLVRAMRTPSESSGTVTLIRSRNGGSHGS